MSKQHHYLTKSAATSLGIIDANGNAMQHSATLAQVAAASEYDAFASFIAAAHEAWRDDAEAWIIDESGDSTYYDGRTASFDLSRQWQLTEEGEGYATYEATSAADALAEAKSNVDRANYSEAEGTIWIDVRVHCAETGEEAHETVTLDADEPECTETAHDWQSPFEIVGGIKENPGVWGKGGGVIITECCMHCGCKRTTDTWAQRPDNGEQGLTSVSYEPGAFADELASLAS